ncbi:MAG: hypothetical protein KDA52_18755, partial [Planctomycetaceae bacterium]|nr:hypothetical protein [Planctomycetaceae bacterium]
VPGISADDWLLVLQSDNELLPAGEHFAKWCGHDLPFEFRPEEGSICHHDPQPNVIAKMLMLAAPLKAVVRGGDGEIYTSGTEFYWPNHPDFEMRGRSLPDSKLAAYLPVAVGLLAMLTLDWLFDTLLVTLAAGATAVVITALLMIIPSLWQRSA